MAGCYALFPVPGLTEINITADSLPQGLGIDSQPDLIAVRAPNCLRVDGDLNYNDAAGFQISNCPNLATVEFPRATTFSSDVYLNNNALLTSVDLSAATTFGGNFYLSGNALTESVVNTLLTMLVAATEADHVTPWHGTCNLSGGTNEAPTVGPPDGIAAVGTLTARFAVVTTN